MKYIVALLTTITVVSLFPSCGSNKPEHKQVTSDTTIVQTDTSSVLSDSMICELKMAHKRSMELYKDEQYYKYVEYIYPNLFRYLKDKSHGSSVETEKSKYVDLLIARNDNYWEKVVPTISPNATSYSFVFKEMEYFHKSGKNLFVIYEQQAFYVTNNDTINSQNTNYGYAIFLDKDNKWFFLDSKTKDIENILKGDFSKADIAEIVETTKHLH